MFCYVLWKLQFNFVLWDLEFSQQCQCWFSGLIMLCRLLGRYHHFRGTYCFHLHGWSKQTASSAAHSLMVAVCAINHLCTIRSLYHHICAQLSYQISGLTETGWGTGRYRQRQCETDTVQKIMGESHNVAGRDRVKPTPGEAHRSTMSLMDAVSEDSVSTRSDFCITH